MTSTRRTFLRGAAVGTGVMLAGCSTGGERSPTGATATGTDTGTPPAFPEPLTALREGAVAFLRPPASTGSPAPEPEGCGREPALTAEGRELARTVGDVFRGAEVPLAEVRASEFCRCLDAARLAFGRVAPAPELTGADEDAANALSAALSTAPESGSRVVVGTGASLAAAADVSLAPGAVAVFDPGGGEPTLVGRVAPSRWSALASAVDAPVAGSGSYTIQYGTDAATPVHWIRSGTAGPTAFVVGGIHGDERAGYMAARRVTDWTPDAGTLVVLPEANRPAIEQDDRYGPSGHDLNRRFHPGERATSPLARAIWDTVVRHDPDVFVDLHSSQGFYQPDLSRVGQAVFHSPDETATARAGTLVSYLNEEVLPEHRRPKYDYVRHEMDGRPAGMLVTRVYETLEIPAFLEETTEADVSVETQTDWATAFTAKLLELSDVRETAATPTPTDGE